MSNIPSRDMIVSAFRDARAGKLPLDSPCWAYVAPEQIGDDHFLFAHQGETVAHAMARQGKLPAGFMQLGIREKDRTLAHLLAVLCKLPAGFSNWEWCDDMGRTVAHEAARFGGLPADCPCLDRADLRGRTVAHELARQGALPVDFEGWGWTTNKGDTVLDIARKWRRADLLAQYEAWWLRRAAEDIRPARARIARSH